ncbi:MAG TPA: FAD-dependent oxidoreductase, partial [Flavitalea sp.]|nr:FAD-dependent oxidoreductase [Flavitalea sp.]
MSKKTAIVVGAGIIGLATARALATRGYQVTVIERNSRAVGASIRNFGMIWPIGQPEGALYQQAALSRNIWLETCTAAGIWHDKAGSLHLAYSPDEFEVLKELQEIYKHRGYKILNAGQVLQKSPAVSINNLLGGLYSTEEIIVNPRAAIPAISEWLHDKFGVKFIWGTAATRIDNTRVWAGDRYYESDQIYVCSGADFETLYPEIFALQPITKCKLQMLKIKNQPDNWRIGPALCGGLSLLHYPSFKSASSLGILK